MNTEWTRENICTYNKMHYGEAILAKIRKLEKTMIKYSSNTNHLQVLFVAIQKNMGPFYGWGSTGLRLEAVYFLPPSSQEFLVLILSTSEG